MAERLTKKDKPIIKNQLEDNMSINESTAIKRLWKYENVMEKYNIESIELLEHIIKKGMVINPIIDDFAKEEYDKMKQDRDTWKKACKEACDVLRDINYKIYNEDRIDFENSFYQQAKKDGNDERN